MSGHSKWSTIKRKKGLVDAKRSQIFTKIANTIIVAAKDGKDPDTNFKLRLALDKAKSVNMPNENIERAIRRGIGELNGANIEEVIYEAHAPFGVTFIIKATTDNKNRTLADLKNTLTRHGGHLGKVGSVRWGFNYSGVIKILKKSIVDREEIELLAIDNGAINIITENETLVIHTEPQDLKKVKDILEEKKLKIQSAALEYIPKALIKIEDKEAIKKLEKLKEDLDAQEEVNEIYSNLIN